LDDFVTDVLGVVSIMPPNTLAVKSGVAIVPILPGKTLL
jgi:hypothetical protein